MAYQSFDQSTGIPNMSWTKHTILGNLCLAFVCVLAMSLVGCSGGGGGSPPPKLTSFIVSPTNVSLAANTTANLIATGTYSDGKTSLITTQVTWTSAASGVASVGVNSGLVTAGSASGKTTITATLNGFADQLVNITVTAFGGIVITSNTLADARFDHTAALLSTGPSTGKVMVVGGYNDNGALGTTGIFDPNATNPWTPGADLNFPRGDHTSVTLNDGRVLITGGTDSVYTLLASTEIYDPAATTSSWMLTGNLNSARAYNAIVLLGDGKKVLVAGGDTNAGTTNSAEVFDPDAGTWTPILPMAVSRNSATATLLPNNKVLVTGGFDANGVVLPSCELYDPATGQWSLTGSLIDARFSHTAILLPTGPNAGKVLVVGGAGITANLASAELYDPATGTWAPTGALAAARYIHTATLLTAPTGPNYGKILVVGGLDDYGNPLMSTELYNPTLGTWIATSNLAVARDNFTSTYIPDTDSTHPDGKVLSVGGNGPASIVINSSELYW